MTGELEEHLRKQERNQWYSPMTMKKYRELAATTVDKISQEMNMPKKLLEGDSNYSSARMDLNLWKHR